MCWGKEHIVLADKRITDFVTVTTNEVFSLRNISHSPICINYLWHFLFVYFNWKGECNINHCTYKPINCLLSLAHGHLVTSDILFSPSTYCNNNTFVLSLPLKQLFWQFSGVISSLKVHEALLPSYKATHQRLDWFPIRLFFSPCLPYKRRKITCFSAVDKATLGHHRPSTTTPPEK